MLKIVDLAKMSWIQLLIFQIGVAVTATNNRCPTNLANNKHIIDRNEKCYEFVTSRHDNWPHAKEDCVLKGGSLVQIEDMAEADFIMSTLRAIGFSGDILWIGLSDRAEEGKFVWTNGQPVGFSYWGAGQGPIGGFLHLSVVHSLEDCVALKFSDSGHWHDYECSGLLFDNFGWICQYKLPAASTEANATTGQMPNATAAVIVAHVTGQMTKATGTVNATTGRMTNITRLMTTIAGPVTTVPVVMTNVTGALTTTTGQTGSVNATTGRMTNITRLITTIAGPTTTVPVVMTNVTGALTTTTGQTGLTTNVTGASVIVG